MDINCSKSFIHSVEDAVKDKVGRRPRTNSTDGELNLPQRGLCDENIVLQTYKWDMKLLHSRNGKSQSPHVHAVPPPRGFVNLGNTCFLNATDRVGIPTDRLPLKTCGDNTHKKLHLIVKCM